MFFWPGHIIQHAKQELNRRLSVGFGVMGSGLSED